VSHAKTGILWSPRHTYRINLLKTFLTTIVRRELYLKLRKSNKHWEKHAAMYKIDNKVLLTLVICTHVVGQTLAEAMVPIAGRPGSVTCTITTSQPDATGGAARAPCAPASPAAVDCYKIILYKCLCHSLTS